MVFYHKEDHNFNGQDSKSKIWCISTICATDLSLFLRANLRLVAKQTEVLKCIEENKGITPKELSEKLEMDAGNLSRRISKLVSNNLIVKEGLGYLASS